MKPIKQKHVTAVVVATFVGLMLALLFLSGCSIPPSRQPVPSQYVARETESGVWIFEYHPGDRGHQDANNLVMFMDCLSQWTKDHPELELRRLEVLHTKINTASDASSTNKVISVVNVLAYTKTRDKVTPLPGDGK
jgi:hypothetical protein